MRPEKERQTRAPIFLIYFSFLMPLNSMSQTDLAVKAGKDVAIVNTSYGVVRGYIRQSTFIFKGIPYGKAARFMAPERPERWEGVRNSMSYGPVCPSNSAPEFSDEFAFAFQRDAGTPDENCLNLNIWTQHIDLHSKRPVMVWLHGGGFSSGSAHEFPSLDGESLSKKGDIVLVSFNHRLNVLGFLDLSGYGEKYNKSANAGALDMVLALNWVKENIASFGGDPENVTIFGQSGGGTKVMCLMNAPAAKGLFCKAIVQSGSSLTHIITAATARKVAAELLVALHLQPNQVDSLQKIPYAKLEAAGNEALKKVAKTLKPEEMSVFGLEWEPVKDDDFLPYQPFEKAATELSKDIPLLVGSCKNEFMPFIPGPRHIPTDAAYMAAVKEAYPNTVTPSDYLDIDLLFRPLAINQADQKAATGKAPVYMYVFTWQSPVLDGAFKAFHCMDLPFVFGNIQRCEEMTGGGKEAYLLADQMSGAWINFAKSGNPNTKSLPLWPEYATEAGATMMFDTQCTVKYHHDKKLLAIHKSPSHE